MAYEILPHAADIEVEARATDIAQLFAEAARGMAAVILGAEPPSSDQKQDISVKGADVEDTLVQFLDQCLYRFESNGDLVVGADLSVSPSRAEGTVYVVEDAEATGTDVKAVTYQGLVVTRVGSGWITKFHLTE